MNQYTETSEKSTKSGFQGASYAKLAKSAVLGTIAGIFSSVALMIVFAFVINLAFGDPDGVINIFTGIAASLGAAIGGFYASRVNGAKGFISGVSTGILISLVLFAVMVFNGKTPSENRGGSDITITSKLVIILCQIIFACAGGIFAVNSHKNKKSARSYPIGKKK